MARLSEREYRMRLSFRLKSIARWAPLLGVLALVAAGCGGGDDAPAPTAEPTAAPTTSVNAEPDTSSGQMVLVPAGNDFAVGGTTNVPFVTMSQDGQIISVSDITVRFFADALGNPREFATVQAFHSSPGGGEVETHEHSDGSLHEHGGEDEGRGFFYATVAFDEPGFWGLFAAGKLEDGTAVTGQMTIEVLEAAAFPAPGETAIASDNLTKFDVDDIGTIDTGSVPNDLHEVKIKDAIAAGRPLVIAFATPGFCQTQFCGSVVQEVESLHDDYAEDVDFVHIEIWLDPINRVLNPTVIEWLEQPGGGFTEPWVYVIDKNGTIFERWGGPVARVIMEDTVKAVAAGETYNTD